MKMTLKGMVLAASLSALAAPAVAQNTSATAPKVAHKATLQNGKKRPQKHSSHAVQKSKRAGGEAASLERKEAGASESRDMRDDNRGRVTASSAHVRNVAKTGTQQHHPAALKTGQLTTHQTKHLETKETALHRDIHSDREQDGKLTPGDPSQNAQQIHLKKHNARMF